MKLDVKTLDNKAAGDITVDESIFGVKEIRSDIIHLMVVYQQDKTQAGTRKTQTRSEVTGTGKKPHAQKGTGRARAGDAKRNIDRGGAVPHGPRVRSHATELPKRIRKMAMRHALSSKVLEGKLIVLDDAKAKDHKTKAMASAMEKMGIQSALIVGGKEIEANFARATSNLKMIDVLPSQGANVYDIMRRDTLVLTKEAINDLTEKLKD